MRVPASLQDESTAVAGLRSLVSFFQQHGATGYGIAGGQRILPVDAQLADIVPLIFWLLPREAIFRCRADLRVKPLIRERLQQLGIPIDEDLVSVLKGVCDQYYRARLATRRKRKYGVSDLRASGYYQVVSDRQNQRCAICGGLLVDSEVHLDHIIPWYLVGDVPDGSNWQLLCASCNRGKREYLTARQNREFSNWIYGMSEAESLSDPLRFVTLALSNGCLTCGKGPSECLLRVELGDSSGLLIYDNLVVYCNQHGV
jgi:5-methylcytosine-specific restriction endonuclease McrA